MILTNVRLTIEEHQAAKRLAVELGVPLSELLRRGLQLVLKESGSEQLRERAEVYATSAMTREERLRVLEETEGALRWYDTWQTELQQQRAEAWRDVWGDDDPASERHGEKPQ
ncbi:MAG TPA: hypothetical protein VNM16_01815 [Bacillota bacterium]|nr:hypothetical protein [Bacillota bacterium]